MSDPIPIDRLANEIRNIYISDKNQSEKQIEKFLTNRFKELSGPESLDVLNKLIDEFDNRHPIRIDNSIIPRTFSFLLGRDVSRTDLSSTELIERLAESLKTIFDSLNQLIGVINMTLTGETFGDQTIRQVIGFHLEGEGQGKSLESYIGQINKAFLTVQRSFKKTAQVKVSQILEEIDPDRICAQAGGGLKIGALRRAEYYEIYEETFRKIKKWFESGRFMEEFLREFEKNCQNLMEE
jgi:PAS domain-containing protein